MEELEKNAKNIGLSDKMRGQKSLEEVCRNVKEGDKQGLFIFSTPHGDPIDQVVEGMREHLSKGDILIDCANENYASTQRRQKILKPDGIHYIGCGVSGGYQSARAGPSFSPGGDPEVLNKLMPFFKQLAAKDQKGRPCVAPVGPGGSGHYVKTLHNGIEQGMMSVLAETWSLLHVGLGLSNDEVGDIFGSWNKEGMLHDCFLVSIGADILHRKDENGDYILDKIRDKVVQDVDDSELTGNWTCEEAMALHMPAATIVSSHMFRYESAFASQRSLIKDATKAIQASKIEVENRKEFTDAVHSAVCFGFLSCFAEGLNIIRAKDKQQEWNLDYHNILQLWRGGCIIQADGIIDILDQMYARADHCADDIFENDEVAKELSTRASDMKKVVLKALEADLVIPSMSQSYEHFKYTSSTTLPTQFMEAQLDYFGNHKFDTWQDPPGGPKKGKHHYEWKPAKGRMDE